MIVHRNNLFCDVLWWVVISNNYNKYSNQIKNKSCFYSLEDVEDIQNLDRHTSAQVKSTIEVLVLMTESVQGAWIPPDRVHNSNAYHRCSNYKQSTGYSVVLMRLARWVLKLIRFKIILTKKDTFSSASTTSMLDWDFRLVSCSNNILFI